MKYDAIVVGAGLSGASSANILANAGKKVLVIEQKKHIAGHCYDFNNEDNIYVHKYGPHIFHCNSSKTWDFVNQFTGFHHYQHKVLSYANGNFINFPINRDTLNKFFGVELTNSDVELFLQKEVDRSRFNYPHQNFRDAVVSQVGETLYQCFYENYTRKQWNCDPEELAPELAGRIPVRKNNDDRYFTDKYQGIPKNGYTNMVENMLDHQNIHILSNCDYFDVKDDVFAPLTVYTGELDRFFNFKYGELQYRSLKIDLKTIETDSYQPAAVINYPNDYDWVRITEFKKLTNTHSPKTTVSYEYPLDKGTPFYIVPNKKNFDIRDKYLKELSRLEKTSEYIFSGRLAEYKYYNMNEAIEAATQKVESWLMKRKSEK